MEYYVYILESINTGKRYIGSTQDLEKRITDHNSGKSTWTKKYRPWKLIYSEVLKSKSEAIRRELEIKNYKGGYKFKKLILPR